MPMVDGKKYSYTPKGKSAAAKARENGSAAKKRKQGTRGIKSLASKERAATPKNRRTKTIGGRRGR